MNDIFVDGGCPLTTAGALSACACTNITLQAHLSTCVQKSCSFVDQRGRHSAFLGQRIVVLLTLVQRLFRLRPGFVKHTQNSLVFKS